MRKLFVLSVLSVLSVVLVLSIGVAQSQSWKGHSFTRADIGSGQMRTLQKEAQATRRPVDQVVDEFLKNQTERYRIVATDPQYGPIVAEELDSVRLNKLPDAARSVARNLYQLTPDMRRAVLGAFNADGTLKYPWPVNR